MTRSLTLVAALVAALLAAAPAAQAKPGKGNGHGPPPHAAAHGQAAAGGPDTGRLAAPETGAQLPADDASTPEDPVAETPASDLTRYCEDARRRGFDGSFDGCVAALERIVAGDSDAAGQACRELHRKRSGGKGRRGNAAFGTCVRAASALLEDLAAAEEPAEEPVDPTAPTEPTEPTAPAPTDPVLA